MTTEKIESYASVWDAIADTGHDNRNKVPKNRPCGADRILRQHPTPAHPAPRRPADKALRA
jgi:hypothetical protein